ncbi:DUF6443 domain-containing protein [Flectobacillus major]|uniref:DUF6443 domain-containing protein n=1 Tax=Flectobacillus major TaxID=103 RepID=UPI00131F1922|nr:DUF6443 domain-containing protein [Flectobacillus major]
MKKTHLTFVLSVFTVFFSLAQKQDSTGRDSLIIKSVVPPPSNSNTYTPNLILPSPHAATLGNYGNTPINLSSGLATPSISLLDLKEGNIEMNVGISYQYKGFKPFESPSILGRGWSLSAGGVITRVIKSKPDERRPVSSNAYGYATAENRTNIANLINNDGTIVQPAGQSLFYSIPDGEPDMFVFNFMGMTGKFFFGEDGTIHVVSDRKIKIDYRVVKLTQTIANNPNIDLYHFVEFSITDENGTTYKFGDTNTNISLPIKNVEFSSSGSDFDCTGGNMNITSWFLAEIADKNGSKINFNYTNDYLYQSGDNNHFNFTLRGRNTSSPVARGQYNTSQQTYYYDNMWSCVSSLENFLTSIKGTNWTVNFEYDKKENVTYLIKTTLLANTIPKQEIKKFIFNFSNLTNPDGLLLSALTESSLDNTIAPQHLFTYYNAQNLYYQNPFAIDYWGFDNGAYNNTTLIADPPFNAQRNPNFLATQKGALTTIIYPTGGSTQFVYEQNDYGQLRESEYENGVLINKKDYGGLRIKTIIDKDVNGDILSKKEYKYDSFSNINKSSGVISSSIGLTKLRYIDAPINTPTTPRFPVLPNKDFYYSEGLHTMAEIPIYYTNVTETLSDNSITKTTFTSHNDYNDFWGVNFGWGNNQIGSSANYSLMRSLPKEVKYYNNNTLVKETKITYNLVDRHKARSLYTGNATATPSIQQTIDFLKTYYTYSGWLQKVAETERLYVDPTNFIETITNYHYSNSNYLQLTSVSTQSSKGETLLTNYKYPYDFGTEPYLTMTNKNIIAPVIEETNLLDNTQAFWKFTDYATFGTLQLPQKIRTQIGSGAIITPITFDNYDSRGNLTQYSTRNGQTATMQYYGTLDLGKTDLLKSQTIDGSKTATLLNRTVSYDYVPLVGRSSETDINGYTTTYWYDVFSRLKSIKDTQGYLLKDFHYHYANQTALSGWGIIPTNTMNYVVSRTAKEAQGTASLSSDIEKTTTQIQYMDGLGRSLQSLIWKGLPDKTKDIIVSTTLYDTYGRPYKDILPIPSETATAEYTSTAQNLGITFYGDNFPFTETVFESSPLNRPLRKYGAGQAWRTADKFTKFDYWLAGNEMIRFDIQANGLVNGNTRYPNSSLYNNLITSERGIWTMEVKDKQGRIIGKLQQLEANTFNFATTAYVYNNLGQLSYVVTPNAYKGFENGTFTSFTENDNLFLEGIYGYHYDNQGRLTEKHIPGTGWTRYVYDKQDRIVLENDDKDANTSPNYWKFSQYDALGRVIRTGLINNIGTYSRSQLQSEFDAVSVPYEERGSTLLGYTNRSFPSSYTPAETNIKTVNYYDDYTWQTETAYNFQAANAFHTQANTKGLQTGALVRNLESNDWYKSVNYYDYKGRVIQDFQQTIRGNIIRKDYQYRFNGELLTTRITKGSNIKILSYEYDHLGRKTTFRHSLNGNEKTIAKYIYDEIGRLKSKQFSPTSAIGSSQTGDWTNSTTWQGGSIPSISDNVRINTGHNITIPTGKIATAGSLYNAGTLYNNGTLQLGTLSLNASTTTLYSLDYKYHIRGGVKGINLDANNNLTNSLFSYKLDYEEDGTYYDGNIRNQYWKSNIDGIQRAYQYNYDGASRITAATYGSTKAGENYALNNVTYDANGNIKTLSRNGATNTNYTSFGNVDNLSYTYQTNSNKLLKIQDATIGNPDLGDFRDGTNTNNDYEYWEDGSLKKDKNKKIASITYNYLKLPKTITFDNGRTITTQYDAQGSKLKKIDSNGETTDYEEDEIYVNNVLYQTSHDEGRIVNGVYEYNIIDHLGNLRVSLKDSAGIAVPVQSLFYDPWGLSMKGMAITRNPANFNKFQFLNRETQFETGYIDLIHRQFDPSIARFTSQDPVIEGQEHLSLYQYSWNNPLRYTAPDGKAATDITLLGANNSSVTVKTDLVDLKINASGLGIDFGGNHTLSGNDILQVAVDIGGVFDPTPTLDVLGASLSAKSGDYWGAGASILGAAIPFAGDLAKTSKVTKGIDKISDAIDAVKGADNAKGGVYVLKDGDTVVRTGRTKDLATREAQHKNDPTLGKYEFETKYKTDSYAEQRGLEHKVSKQYESTASKANGGHNKINAIGDKNPNKAKYIQAADDYLKRQ